tara:strand:+ start:3749 stop:4075 length:327 start_codon:yes stop_codon:yes gene_type:complete
MDVDETHVTPATPEVLVEEFFRARDAPADTHEEWLLRLCAQLMEREAHRVSLLEAQQQQQQQQHAQPAAARRRGRRGGNGGHACSSSSASAASTAASTETGSTSWSES